MTIVSIKNFAFKQIEKETEEEKSILPERITKLPTTPLQSSSASSYNKHSSALGERSKGQKCPRPQGRLYSVQVAKWE